MKSILLVLAAAFTLSVQAQREASVRIYPEQGKQVIHKNIYGQFAEHLGSCIYGGLWVGPESDIPNVQGYRTDVLEALKKLQVPVLRWPGGCFADEYHWMDGIGPVANRPRMVNNNWGGTVEDNSFGTHEFLNLCELIGCEPYVSLNVGSGTVEEMAKWVEYMTAEEGPMAKLRKENGREKPWKVKYIGVGNESWGCGGSMRPEYYADLYRRYATYCRNYNGNQLFKIASGASDYDYNWTKVLMQRVGNRMHGLSLHYYTVMGWDGSKGSATNFTDEDYYWALGKCLEIEPVMQKHIQIMDEYDPQKQIALLVDEWGTWWDEEPGTIQGHLYQQNTLRDAFVAALTLNVFHKYTDRVQMTNIAQIANVLQAMVLTEGNKMLLTPTYHVFEMYKVHQNATYLPLDLICDKVKVRDNREVPMLSVSASRDNAGKIHISLANVDLKQSETVRIDISGLQVKAVNGRILTAPEIQSHNTFEDPDVVKPVPFRHIYWEGDELRVEMPSKSIIVLEAEIQK